MYKVDDVAKVIILYCYNNKIEISNLKLQKLLYWLWIEFFIEERERLFLDKFYAWQFGPVCVNSYYNYSHFGAFNITDYRFAIEDCENHKIPYKMVDKIEDILSNFVNLPIEKIVELCTEPNSPWDIIYNDGNGENRTMIPFFLIEVYAMSNIKKRKTPWYEV